jgi:cytochrome c peroxidase
MDRTQPLAFSLAALSLLAACGGSEAASTDWKTTPLGLEAAQSLHAVPADNPLTEAKVALGKQLFFDKRLSKDGTTSCETCHQHELGWSNGERFSTKVGGGVNTRNSPTLYNLAYHDKLYWDGRAPSLEANIGAAWKGHMNGGEDTAERAAAIGKIDAYARQFQAVFGGAPTSDAIAKALAAFVRTLRTGNSAWDRYEKTKDKSLVSADAIAGHELFSGKAGCVVCHVPPLYTDRLFHAVGVGEAKDVGRGAQEPDNPLAQGAFKTPTLRDVADSGPYFHDGSVADLREAVKIMASGGGSAPHFEAKDPLLVDRKLTDQEIDQLVAFLKTLASSEPFAAPALPQ